MWSIVARFTTLGEAEAARSALDAAGIPCRIGDENMIAIDWLYSNAVGGVKLLVDDEDRDDAAEVLASTAAEASDADDVSAATDVPPEPESAAMQCPACGNLDVQRIPRFRIFCALSVVAVGVGVALGHPAVILAALVTMGLITVVAPSHRCRVCGERWTAADLPERAVPAPPPEATETLDLLCRRCGSKELHRVHYRRLTAIPLIATPVVVLVVPIWLLLPGWKCDTCGRRAWFR